MSSPNESSAEDPQIRQKALGDFVLRKRLGSGSMGVVYLAEQRSRQRAAAVKVLFPHQATKQGYVERFYREASMMARLNHPNLVRCYRAGREKGHCYFGMELVDGFPLTHLVKNHRANLSVGNALYLIIKCASALQHAHEQSIVHRDVKPGNVMITWQGGVKITDMGLAKFVDDDISLTRTGVGMGTPDYIAPEQARNAKRVDHRADLYSLGILLYQLLTGELPFFGQGMVELILSKEQAFFIPASRLNPKCPPKIDDILRRVLKPNPQHRYENCAEFLEALDQIDLPPVPIHVSGLGIPLPARVKFEPSQTVEQTILLVHDQPQDVRFAQEALQKRDLEGRIQVVEDGTQALLYLQQKGAYSGSDSPSLLVLGTPLAQDGMMELLSDLQQNPQWSRLPVLVIPSTATSRAVLRAHGISTTELLRTPEDIRHLQILLS